jgi:hypothetical protein
MTTKNEVSCDKTAPKMGHPIPWGSDVGHAPTRFLGVSDVGHPPTRFRGVGKCGLPDEGGFVAFVVC